MRRHIYYKGGRILVLFFFMLSFPDFVSKAQTIAFDQSALNFNGMEEISSGTSLKFGPDGRLYAVQLNGEIKIYTIDKPSPNNYVVTSIETLFDVKTIPNYDDNGQPAYDNRNKRQSTGILVVGTASNPVIYVSSSDPKWGGPSGDKALDTNSGIITRLTWNGTAWEVVDLVRGLPRSEENHSTNGLQWAEIQGKPYLLVASGGLTNAGSPSKNFTFISEYALSAAILSIDLNAIEALPTKVDAVSGRSYKYDLPTLDDPSRPNVNGIYDPNHPDYDGVDVNDPFGGNDGLNMAMWVEDSPVQVFSAGYRNAYDLVVTEAGRLYVTDNGANGTWGGLPEHEGNPDLVNNNYRSLEPGGSAISPDDDGEYVDNKDHLIMVSDNLQNYVWGSRYGGHPTPIRANPGVPYEKGQPFPYHPGGAGLYTSFVADNDYWDDITPAFTPKDTFRTQILQPIAPGQPGFDDYAATSLPANWPPVAPSLRNPAEADFIAPTLYNPDGPQPDIVTVLPNNTNGIAEYTASNFDGAMKGALIAGKNGGTLHYLEMNTDGTLKSIEFEKWNLNGGNSLGITCNSDDDLFPGTIWVSTFDNRILVLTPADDVFCIAPDDPDFDPEADYDHDGYTNQDELDNGTDPCSGASRPNDFDNDKVSDLNDLDDDGDGIPDELDPFQIGSPVNLPVNNELFSNQMTPQGEQSGYLGLGLTGLMNNGDPNPNWLNWLDKVDEGPAENDVYGGTAGAIQVAMTGGTANGAANNQEKGFQLGVNVSAATQSFIISSGMMSLAAPGHLYQYEGNGEVGIQMGDGTQDNFIKLVLTKTHVVAGMEINNVEDPNPLMVAIPAEERPSDTELVELIFQVDAQTGEVEPMIKIGSKPGLSLGTIQASGKILEAIQTENVPLAVGIIGSSHDPAKEFIAGWDYIRVVGEQPHITRRLRDVERILGDPDLTIDLDEYFGDNGGTVNLVYSVSNNSNPLVGALVTGDILTLQFPHDAVKSSITVRATDQNGYFVEQSFQVTVVEANTVLLRINTGGPRISGFDSLPDWKENSVSGNVVGAGYTVNSGNTASGYEFDPQDRHASIPDYIDDSTYAQLFGSERYNTDQTMSFNIPLPNGQYLVNLYMGNGFIGTATAGKRYFDIEIEGEIVAASLDLAGTYGHLVGAMQQYSVNLTDGELNLDFLKKKENPLINAIEIIGKPIHTPITFTPFEDQYSMINEDLNSGLVVMASGGDGNLNFEATGLPPGIYIEPTNGTIYGTVSETALGNSPYLVTITINDDDQINSDAESFNFTWHITPPLTEMRWTDKDEDENYAGRHENSFVQAGDRFYLMGGRESAQHIDVYNYETNTWTRLENSAPEEFNHFQATEFGGMIWVIGAFRTNNFPQEVPADHIWIFDPANEEWIQGPEIPEARRRGAAGLVTYNNKLYVIGGNTIGHDGGYVAWFDEYDPATGTWTVLDDAPRARDHFFAAVIGNRLYAASGRLSGGAGGSFAPVIPEVDVFNFTSRTWSTLPEDQNLPTPRAAAVVAAYKEKLIVAGGEIAGNPMALSVVEMYDPLTRTWTTLDSLNHPRHGTQGIVSGNGLYVLAGSPNRGGGNQKNMEFFGTDNPDGSPVIASEIKVDSAVTVKKGILTPVKIEFVNGNQSVYIRSIRITGEDALNFEIIAGAMTHSVVPANSSHEILLEYVGSPLESSAVLEIEYGKSSSRKVQLNGDGVYEHVSLFFNTGTNADVEFEGEQFLGDQNFPGYFTTSVASKNTQASSLPLFTTERFGKNFNYAVPLPNGIYTVKTYHNELWFGQPGGTTSEGPGKRVFDILIEGKLVKDNLDLYFESGNQPTILTFENIEVTDGVLDLNLSASINNATVSGLAIINQGPLDGPPVAVAAASVQEGTVPLTVNFTGSGSLGNVLGYHWDFGDGTVSDEADPSHTFAQAGTYLVSLTVEGESGLSDMAELEITVLPDEAPEGFSLYLNTGSALDVTYEGQTYLGDGNFSSYYGSSGTYRVEAASDEPLYQTERNGKMLNYTIPVPNGTYTVKTHHNELYFGVNGPAASPGRRVFDISIEGVLVKDNFDVFVEGNNQPTVLTFAEVEVTDGMLNILMAASANNVSISGITILGDNVPLPLNASISASVQQGVVPLTVSFTGSGSAGDIASYHWDFGDGSVSDEVDPAHTFAQAGTYLVSLTVEGDAGFSDTAALEVTVLPEGAPEVFSLYLNTGSPADVVYDGKTYLGDANFSSYYGSSGTYRVLAASNEPLYQTERNGKVLNYAIPVPNGTYTVKTHHNELYFGVNGPAATAGRRVFDISVEGVLVQDNFDIFVAGANQPTVNTVEDVVVTDGVLNINMAASANNVSISGITVTGSVQKAGDAALRKGIVSENEGSEETLTASEKRGLIINLYPNPAKTETMLTINREIDLQHILVHNMGGQLVHQFNPSQVIDEEGNYYLPLADLPQGVYVVSLLSDNDLIRRLRLVVSP